MAELKDYKIGLAGAGGLGSNCAAHLVRAGLKKFVIADFDVVSESNLNRQFFFKDQVGEKKVTALATNLRRIAGDLELELHDVKLDADSLLELFADCDIIVECFDRAEAKAMFLRTLLPTGKKLVSASGMAGVGNSNAMRVKAIGKNLALVGDGESGISETMPPLSPRVGIAAAMEANAVLSMLLGYAL